MCPDPQPSDPSTLSRPFDPEPKALAEPKSGCSRMALIGCAAAAILVGVGLVAMMLKARDLVVWSLSSVRTQIEADLPEDLPEGDRSRLASAFEAALARIESDELDPEGFRRLQAALLEFARSPQRPDHADVRRLAEELERFAADAGEDPPARPDERPPDDPEESAVEPPVEPPARPGAGAEG